MNRFFSKLDLRDIKIDPTGMSFPPDADETEVPDDVIEESIPEPAPFQAEVAAQQTERVAHTPTWSASPAPSAVAYSEDSFSGDPGFDEVAVVAAPRANDVLKVSARSRPSAVAGAIAGVVRELGRAEVQAIGAGATNQAVKAVAIARDYLRETGIDAICLPAFIDVTIDNEDRTAIRLVIEPR